MKRICAVIATCFGAGYLPYGPGTLGSLISLGICVFLPTDSVVFVAFVAAGSLISIPLSYGAETYFNRTDDRRIIIDEVVGFMTAVALLPRTMIYFLAAFVLFRIFDIFKFSIIKRSQDLPYGIGVVADDLLAGLAANVILQTIRMLIRLY